MTAGGAFRRKELLKIAQRDPRFSDHRDVLRFGATALATSSWPRSGISRCKLVFLMGAADDDLHPATDAAALRFTGRRWTSYRFSAAARQPDGTFDGPASLPHYSHCPQICRQPRNDQNLSAPPSAHRLSIVAAGACSAAEHSHGYPDRYGSHRRHSTRFRANGFESGR